VLNERDEAREQLDLTKRELGRWVDREAKAVRERDEAHERKTDLRTMLEQVTRERDEARAACPDCAMWAERSARWHDDMQRAERERDEAREVLRVIASADWKTSGELRGMARKALEVAK